MTQLAFDFDLLDEAREYETYACGIHRQTIDHDAHWIECRELACPRCGEVSLNPFLAGINHGLIEWRAFCFKQINLLNHAARCRMILAGEWPHTPQANCFAEGHVHPEANAGNYFRKGAPLECIQAEFDQKRDWLTSHNVAAEHVGSLGIYNALKDAA